LGAKIEIKNLNSFSGVRRALAYEIPRQIDVLRSRTLLRQETRRWDDVAEITEPMRTKEEAHDYRYFPEPDLMPLEPTAEWLAEVRAGLVELPLARKRRFERDYQLPATDAETFKSDLPLGDYFAGIARESRNSKAIANWVINNLRAKLAEAGSTLAELRFPPAAIPELVELVDSGQISSRTAQEVFAEMFASGEMPSAIVERRGLGQVSDSGAIEQLCAAVIAENPRSAADFRSGKVAALNFLKGQVMKRSQGRANPARVGEVLARLLVSGAG
jgi:aspartyl-tRNA(Asn)/glutamyl-tRNA(Gln) amidotransferase subunit B